MPVELRDVGGRDGFFVTGRRFGEAQVLGDRRIEQKRILGHDAEHLRKRLAAQFADG